MTSLMLLAHGILRGKILKNLSLEADSLRTPSNNNFSQTYALENGITDGSELFFGVISNPLQ